MKIEKIRFVDGVYEIYEVTEEWDLDSGFDETLYFHMINMGWQNC